MVGPSSSHTAGAVRIGLTARRLLGEPPIAAEILLHGSFAATYRGHGTDRALAAGILGMLPDDTGIPNSLQIAKQARVAITFSVTELKEAHPNTALLRLRGASGKTMEIQASSVGGGRIHVDKIDGIPVSFSADMPTLIVRNTDQPGSVSDVAKELCRHGINIATMQLYRDHRGGCAIMVFETDQSVPDAAVAALEQMPEILSVIFLDGFND